MGEKDIESLSVIFQYIKEICKDNGWPFNFIMDSGHHENAIQIYNTGMLLKPPMNTRDRSSNIIIEPDFLDFQRKIVIEYNEEATKNTGAKRNKGHHPLNRYDAERTVWLTKISNPPFKMLIIWESDKNWKGKVSKFLEECMIEVVNN